MFLVAPLPPLESAIPYVTLGFIEGVANLCDSVFLTVIANKDCADFPVPDNVRIERVWTRGWSYPFKIFSKLCKLRAKKVLIEHEFFLYGGYVSAILFPLLLALLRISGIDVVVIFNGAPSKTVQSRSFSNLFLLGGRGIRFKQISLFVLTRIISTLPGKLVVHSSYVKRVLVDDYYVNNRKIRIIPLGVRLVPENAECPTYLDTNKNRLISFFGYIAPNKGMEDLFLAFKGIKTDDLRLVLVGGTHNRGHAYFDLIVGMIQSLGLDTYIVTTGFVPENVAYGIIRSSAYVVLPYRESISSSLALTYAVSCAKPVIVTDLPSFREIVREGYNGLIVPPANPQKLADTMETLLNNKSLREALSVGMEETRRTLLWSNLVQEYLTF